MCAKIGYCFVICPRIESDDRLIQVDRAGRDLAVLYLRRVEWENHAAVRAYGANVNVRGGRDVRQIAHRDRVGQRTTVQYESRGARGRAAR